VEWGTDFENVGEASRTSFTVARASQIGRSEKLVRGAFAYTLHLRRLATIRLSRTCSLTSSAF
jgi:hypothetical protein